MLFQKLENQGVRLSQHEKPDSLHEITTWITVDF